MKALAAVALILFSIAASAQTQAIVPFPPGGGLDTLTRIMTQAVARRIAVEHDKWAKVIREKHIKAE